MHDDFLPPHFDRDALSVRLRAGHFIGERTAFVSHRVENRPLVFDRPLGLSRDAIIDGYIAHFRQAMAPLPPEVVLLSGGRDSRHIFLELVTTGRKPRLAISVDLPGNNDAQIAARLCARAGVTHRVLQSAGRLSDWECEKNLLTAFSAVEHAWLVPLRAQIAELVVYDGIGGDVLSAGLLQSRELVERYTGEPDRYATDFLGSDAVDRVLPGSFSPEAAHAALRAEMSRYSQAVNPLATFLFWNRTMRYIAVAPMGAKQVLTPYLEPRLFEFLSRIPPEHTWDHQLHTDAIARAYPDWVDIPYSTKRPLQQPAAMRRFALDALRRTRWRGARLAAPLVAMAARGSDANLWAAQLAFLLEQLVHANPRDFSFDPRFVTGTHVRAAVGDGVVPA
jgi:asparagine synthase (glutamine-hydrolysing)